MGTSEPTFCALRARSRRSPAARLTCASISLVRNGIIAVNRDQHVAWCEP
jgi:hypothetical protein